MGAQSHRRLKRAARVGMALAAAGLLAAVALLAGCAKSGSGKKTIVFWQFSPLAAVQPVVDRFEAENPDLDVVVEQLTWQSGREKIVAAVAASRPPDLCELGSTFLPGLVADSTLIDLTDSIPDLRAALVGWDGVSYRGRAYAIPWMLGTRALYVNEELLERAGLIRAARDLGRAARGLAPHQHPRSRRQGIRHERGRAGDPLQEVHALRVGERRGHLSTPRSRRA